VPADDRDEDEDDDEDDGGVEDEYLSDYAKTLGVIQPDDSECDVARALRGHILPDAFHRHLNVQVEGMGPTKPTAANLAAREAREARAEARRSGRRGGDDEPARTCPTPFRYPVVFPEHDGPGLLARSPARPVVFRAHDV